VIVLVLGGIIGYQIWHQKHAVGGLVKEQTVTLTSGSDYAFTSSGDLKRLQSVRHPLAQRR
jgi:hypothetical protein